MISYWLLGFRMLVFGLVVGCLYWFWDAMRQFAFTPDLPWLLRAGEWMLQQHRLPQSDLFSWTFPHQPWVLYQWLFEVGFAKIVSGLGLQGALKAFVLFCLVIYGVIPYWFNKRRGVACIWAILIPAIALFIASVNLSLRPMVMSTLGLLAQYILLEAWRAKQIKTPWVLGFVFAIYALWANMHTGFVFGLLSLGCFAIGDLKKRQPEYLYFLAAAAFGSLLNPYGIGVYTYFVALSQQSYLNTVIMELASPNFHLPNYWGLTALVVLIGWLVTRAKQVFEPHEWLHLTSFLLMTFCVQRVVVWFALFAAIILPKVIQTMVDLRASDLVQAELERFSILRPLLALALVAGVVCIFTLPVSAVKMSYGVCDTVSPLLKRVFDVSRPQRLFADPEIGSCVIHHDPLQRVFVDTRFDFYGSDFTQAGRNTLGIQKNWQKHLNTWHPDVLIVGKQWPLAHALAYLPQYQKRFETPNFVVYDAREHR